MTCATIKTGTHPCDFAVQYPALGIVVPFKRIEQWGLEEALLLCVLEALCPSAAAGHPMAEIRSDRVLGGLPFWQLPDVLRIGQRLVEKQALVEFSCDGDSLSVRLPSGTEATPHSEGSWRPSSTALDQLTHHRIPESFALAQVPLFLTHLSQSRNSATSLDQRFIHYTIRQWRSKVVQCGQAQPAEACVDDRCSQVKDLTMPSQWQPSAETVRLLVEHHHIEQSFIMDKVPGFECYWREREGQSENWNSVFRKYVSKSWQYHQHEQSAEQKPSPMSISWEPDDEVFHALSAAGVELSYAQCLVAEYRLYWRERQKLSACWNTMFLQFVKSRWANRHTYGIYTRRAEKPTRDLSLAEHLMDRSWANMDR